MPRYTFKRDSEINEVEARAMINKAEPQGVKALIAFIYLYGCRIAEAVGKKPFDDIPGMKLKDFELTEKQLIAKIAIEKKRMYSIVCPCGTARQSRRGMVKHQEKTGHEGSEIRKKS